MCKFIYFTLKESLLRKVQSYKYNAFKIGTENGIAGRVAGM